LLQYRSANTERNIVVASNAGFQFRFRQIRKVVTIYTCISKCKRRERESEREKKEKWMGSIERRYLSKGGETENVPALKVDVRLREGKTLENEEGKALESGLCC
jgi:hypothetical protein